MNKIRKKKKERIVLFFVSFHSIISFHLSTNRWYFYSLIILLYAGALILIRYTHTTFFFLIQLQSQFYICVDLCVVIVSHTETIFVMLLQLLFTAKKVRSQFPWYFLFFLYTQMQQNSFDKEKQNDNRVFGIEERKRYKSI